MSKFQPGDRVLCGALETPGVVIRRGDVGEDECYEIRHADRVAVMVARWMKHDPTPTGAVNVDTPTAVEPAKTWRLKRVRDLLAAALGSLGTEMNREALMQAAGWCHETINLLNEIADDANDDE